MKICSNATENKFADEKMITRTRFAIEAEGNSEVAYLLRKVRYCYGYVTSAWFIYNINSVVNASFN